jgi:hypothetical protein
MAKYTASSIAIIYILLNTNQLDVEWFSRDNLILDQCTTIQADKTNDKYSSEEIYVQIFISHRFNILIR